MISNGVFASPDQTGTAGNWTLAGGTFQITGVRLGIVGTPTGQTMTIAGGNLSLLSTAQYGFRLGGVNGPALTGNSNASVSQVSGTATLLGPTGAASLQIGGTGVSVTNLYTLSGGTVYLGSGTQAQSLLLGADTNGTSLAQFSLWGGKLTSAGTISGSQGAGARQVFDFSGGTLAAGYRKCHQSRAGGYVDGARQLSLTTAEPWRLAIRMWLAGSKLSATMPISNAAAMLAIDLGGTNAANAFTNAAGYYDTVTVNGNAVLGGNLNLSLINGYEPFLPLSSPSFTILTASNITGAFANVISGSRLAVTGYPNRSFRVTVTATNAVLDQYQTTTPQAYFTYNSQ